MSAVVASNEHDSYDAEAARIYDVMELDEHGNSPAELGFLVQALGSPPAAHRVLDMTCGTGAQCLGLHRAGFQVTASDLSAPMIAVASAKAARAGFQIDFHVADMRTVSLGRFDAIISMYNAIGHLDPGDFATTIRNAARHLTVGGRYVFDIFDRALMPHLPAHRLMDRVRAVGDTIYVRFTQSRFDAASGRVAFEQTTHVQDGLSPIQEIAHCYTLQTYTGDELKRLLRAGGFADVRVLSGSQVVPGQRVGPLMQFVVATKAAAA